MKHILRTAVAILFLWVVIPAGAQAQSITLDSILPELNNITPEDNTKAGEENFYTFWLIGDIGTEYRAVFNVSEEPAMTFVSGGSMTVDSNVEYDEEEGQFIVTYTAVDLQQIDSQSEQSWDEDETLTVIALSFPVAEGENGPTEQVKGSWVSTAFQEWSLVMPDENSNNIGARVTGDPEDSGAFSMFVAQSALNMMAEFDEEEDGEFQARNMGIYEDDTFVSGDVAAVEGGALLSFTTTLPDVSNDGGEGEECGEEGEGEGEEPEGEEGEDPCGEFGEESFTAANGGSVAQRVTAAPRPTIAMTVNKARIKKGKKVRVTGWIKSGKKGKKIVIQRRIPKAKKSKFKKWHKTKVVTTKAGGRFTSKIKVKKKTQLRAKRKGKKRRTDKSVIRLRK